MTKSHALEDKYEEEAKEVKKKLNPNKFRKSYRPYWVAYTCYAF